MTEPKPQTFMGVHWAPLNVPLSRRLQTLAVFVVIGFLLTPVPLFMLFWYLLMSKWFIIAILYSMWMFMDRHTFKRGSRPSQWLRNRYTWKYFANYFPAKLEKTEDLDPKRNYIFACHPHGIMVLRKVICIGSTDVSKESITYQLTKLGTGNACVIIIGGAKEALEARPGSTDLVLQNRKGFVKMAITCGADLVPVFSFGENELYNQVDASKRSWLKKLQDWARGYVPFTLPAFYGRGILNYTFGFMPFRTPLYTIVGKPIRITKNASPTNDEIARVHQEYLQELSKLFEKHKSRFGIKDGVKLNFI